MPDFGNTISSRDWPIFRRMMRDYLSGRLSNVTGLPIRQQDIWRPLRLAVLLEDLTSMGSADASFLRPEQTNEVQRIRLDGYVTGGSFRLVFDGVETSDIDATASASTMQAALEALSNVNIGDVQVSYGGSKSVWFVHFKGQFAATDVPLLEVSNNEFDLTGNSMDVDAQAVIWRDSGKTETVHSVLPMAVVSTSEPPLVAGAMVVVGQFLELGYGVIAVEPRNFVSGFEVYGG